MEWVYSSMFMRCHERFLWILSAFITEYHPNSTLETLIVCVCCPFYSLPRLPTLNYPNCVYHNTFSLINNFHIIHSLCGVFTFSFRFSPPSWRGSQFHLAYHAESVSRNVTYIHSVLFIRFLTTSRPTIGDRQKCPALLHIFGIVRAFNRPGNLRCARCGWCTFCGYAGLYR